MTYELIKVDMHRLSTYPNAWMVVSLMTMANDMERVAYLRNLDDRVQLADSSHLSRHVGAYTSMMLCGHLYEALLLIGKMRGCTNFRNFIDTDGELSRLWDAVKPYYASNNTLFEWCKSIRNLISFHYKHNEEQMRTAMQDLLTAGYGVDTLIIGKGATPTSLEVGMNAMDAMFLSIIGGKYNGQSAQECNNGAGCQANIMCNHQISDLFVHEVETAQVRVRIFADAFIKRFVSHSNKASKYEIGYLNIKWSK